jgi:hypothetical protein
MGVIASFYEAVSLAGFNCYRKHDYLVVKKSELLGKLEA